MGLLPPPPRPHTHTIKPRITGQVKPVPLLLGEPTPPEGVWATEADVASCEHDKSRSSQGDLVRHKASVGIGLAVSG